MPALDWGKFNSLTGSKNQNFENLCRALIRLHFGQFGQFKALKNQPGVEFHLKLSRDGSVLGNSPNWYGWQCKFHERTGADDLYAASRKDIEDSLKKTEECLPDLTHWILWTPYTLSKKDQEWFQNLETKYELHQWNDQDLDTHLNGQALMLRNAYFGDLILTPDELSYRHSLSIQPIQERWLSQVHQSVDAERTIRKMLGEPDSWDHLIDVGKSLIKAVDVMSGNINDKKLKNGIKPFVAACSAFANTLINFHKLLAQGDIDLIQQKLKERKTLIDEEVRSIPRRLRTSNLPIALDATNALDDMQIAQELLDKTEEFLGVGLVAVLADAGGGKTQMSAQLTAPQKEGRPAGILLHGRHLHKGQSLDDLSRRFSINGNPLESIEKLLASLDAAGKRAGCRLPLIIDGLNEAENPNEWKSELAILSETIKKYPNVLVVCTLRTGEHRRKAPRLGKGQDPQTDNRESFANRSLPENIRRIESEGFGGDTKSAIKQYFNHFKINPGDAEIPLEFLQHPLNLRIFCEVTNPDRDTEVMVDCFPASLSPLFEKYVANACKRISQMPNLSHSYSVSDVQSAIYKLGLEFWESKKREINENNYRAKLSDTVRAWDSSIVNLLSQEGIIFRNLGPGSEPDTFVITPTYDALGGYIVANALLLKYTNDKTFKWLKEKSTISSFTGKNSHELSFDIFNSLIALTPRRISGRHIWKELPDSFKNSALSLTTGIEAKHIDTDTTDALLQLFKNHPEARKFLFSRLHETRAVPNHPLNANFLNSVLRAMPVSTRDLSWTEWVRGTRSERVSDLLSIELRWKADLATRTPSDRLRAKWIMWLLTSTDRELRDIATRALYWFGRGAPDELFEESLNSLSIDDSYVPERMLAASYGVAMARHVGMEGQIFVSEILSRFARSLYDSIFAEDAPFSTTHALIREYATRIIEIVSWHKSELFSSKELKRSKPPFVDGGLREWGEIAKEKRQGLDSPFRMDFENYTLGKLVSNRRNYDYEHEGYQKIRAQILWRVLNLGWSSDLFKNVDSSIASTLEPRRGHDSKKTERYGKKYSWIAFFEMSGFLNDQGKLKENWNERNSSVDIDPSFPERVTKGHIIKADYLGDPQMDLKGWIANGPVPNIDPYLRLIAIQQVEGPWIMLDGFFAQEDESRGRKLSTFMRSFLIAKKDADSFLKNLSQHNLSEYWWLPEKPEVIYTFAGEIPWCDTFPRNNLCELTFPSKIKFNALIPVCDFGWEGYQSSASDAGHATTLAKEIASDLELNGHPQNFDLYTQSAQKATFNLSDQSKDFNNCQSMFFIREDLLKSYLEKFNLSMVWVIWGERDCSSEKFDKIFRGSNELEKSRVVFSFLKPY